jgi:hypothetical protein
MGLYIEKQLDGSYITTGTEAPSAPLILSATAFQDAAETGLGSRARFGEVIRAMQTSANDEILSVFKRYDKSITFEKAKAAAMLSLLVSAAIVTPQERSHILAAWPNG